VFALPLGLIRYSMASYLRRSVRSAEKIRQANETIRRQSAAVDRANQLLRERSTAAMAALSATVDARDAYTAGHSRRVQRLALMVGERLGFSHADLETLGHAALFHDIGKLAVADSVLLKPSQLTDEEWLVMRRHADEGARLIERLGFLDAALPAIRHHHERYDGSGYPLGLAGDDIPLSARVIHLADAVDSMLSNRVYRSARPLGAVLAEVQRGAGTQFCPTCAGALAELAREGALAELASDDTTDVAA
jgi:putative nucleotidyltransferase with HDIG domain